MNDLMMHDHITESPRRFSPWLVSLGVCALLFAAVFLWTFWPVWTDPTGVRIVGLRDMWWFHGPNQYLLDRALRAGSFPFWNPLRFCGQPYAANPQVSLFYPPNLLRAIFLSGTTPLATHTAMAVLLLCHSAAAFGATFLLARRLGLRRPGAIVAAFGFAFSPSFVTAMLALPGFVYFATWLPVVLVLLDRAAVARTTPAQFRWGVGAGLAYAMQVFSGLVFLLPCATVVYVGYYLARRISAASAEEGARPLTFASAGRDLGLLIVMGLVGLASSAALTLPAGEFVRLSDRVRFDFNQIYFGGDCFVPLLPYRWAHANGFAKAELIREVCFWFLPLQALCLLPALAAGWRRNRRSMTAVLVAAYLLMDFTIGRPMPVCTLLRWVSPFDFGAPNYAQILVTLPISLLAGFGINAMDAPPPPAGVRLRRALVVALLGSALTLVFVRSPEIELFFRPQSPWPDDPLHVELPCLVVGLLLLAIARGHWALPLATALLVTAGATWWNADNVAHRFCQSRDVYDKPADTLAISPDFWPDNRRGIADVWPNNLRYDLRGAANGYDPLHLASVKRVVCNPGNEEWYSRAYPDFMLAKNPHVALLLKRSFWLARQWVRAPLPDKDRLFPPTTTAFLPECSDLPVPSVALDAVPHRGVSPAAVETTVWAAGSATPELVTHRAREPKGVKQTFEVSDVSLPKSHSLLGFEYAVTSPALVSAQAVDAPTGECFSLGQYRTAPTQTGRLEWALPDFAGAHVSVTFRCGTPEASVEPRRLYVATDPADEDDLLRVVSRSPNRVSVAVLGLPDYRVLVFLDAWYPGWKARVDGQPAPILRADDAFKAVVVPPGNHRIDFAFAPVRVYAGAATSAVALAVAGTWLAMGLRVRRRVTSPANRR